MPSRSILVVVKTTSQLLSVRQLLVALTLCGCGGWNAVAQESTLLLKNGMVIGPGLMGQASQVNRNAFSSIPSESISARPIVYIDDGLRRTFVNQNLIQTPSDRAVPLQRIETGNIALRAIGDHQRVQAVQGALAVTPFDSFGRRIYSLMTPNGQADVVQGITEISAAYVRVESLNADKTYLWDMRLALSAIPPDRLREILINHADPTNAQGWLNIVALFTDARRYMEARDFLVEAIRRFPELENQRAKLKQFDQLHAEQMFEEVRLRSEAGQRQLAEGLLRGFPLERLSLETKLKAERRLAEIIELQERLTATQELVRRDAAALTREEDQGRVAVIVEEIAARLSANNLIRLADYLRLRDDPALTADQRVALFVGGWLLGSGESDPNLPVMLSAWDARDLVQQFLTNPAEAERQSLIDRLKAMEGGTPRLVSKLISQMLPPWPLPETGSRPGRYVIEVPQAVDSLGVTTRYSLQLPPEYDPDRRYPCVVTLHGRVAGPEAQLDWWAGTYNPEFKMCIGEASRHGYIVIAPHWAQAKQPLYQYTEDEHARVLRSLRDAMRRTSIDVDRVFLSGHQMGGDAAWDIALAHPDLWAGLIAIGADSEKYATQYASNGRYLPLYFIAGALDGSLGNKLTGDQLDDFLKNSKYDCLLTVYEGRGRDHFQEELPRIVEWMNLSSHRRRPPPDDLQVVTARSSDRRFWWLEVSELSGENIVNPYLFEPGKAKIDAARIKPPENGLRVSSFPGKNCILWLNPELVDFSQRVNLMVKGKRRNTDVIPELQVLLEDVRTRGDRQHPYWAKVEF
jgi:pimeloyl-ACP methyl ester carboxylesterase